MPFVDRFSPRVSPCKFSVVKELRLRLCTIQSFNHEPTLTPYLTPTLEADLQIMELVSIVSMTEFIGVPGPAKIGARLEGKAQSRVRQYGMAVCVVLLVATWTFSERTHAAGGTSRKIIALLQKSKASTTRFLRR